jgi:hypothetical protein
MSAARAPKQRLSKTETARRVSARTKNKVKNQAYALIALKSYLAVYKGRPMPLETKTTTTAAGNEGLKAQAPQAEEAFSLNVHQLMAEEGLYQHFDWRDCKQCFTEEVHNADQFIFIFIFIFILNSIYYARLFHLLLRNRISDLAITARKKKAFLPRCGATIIKKGKEIKSAIVNYAAPSWIEVESAGHSGKQVDDLIRDAKKIIFQRLQKEPIVIDEDDQKDKEDEEMEDENDQEEEDGECDSHVAATSSSQADQEEEDEAERIKSESGGIIEDDTVCFCL